MVLEIIILVVLISLSAFFSASEVAFISLSPAKIETMIKRKIPRADLIKKLSQNPRRLLVTILVGNNIVNISAASLATVVASEFFSSAIIGLTTGIMTLLVLVFGEVLPKSYAINHVKKIAILSSLILRIFEFILFPIVFVLEKLSNLLTGKQMMEKVSEEELKALALVGKRQGTIEKGELYMINRVFTLNDITAEDIMTPWASVECVVDEMNIEEAADIITHKTHTRFPVVNKKGGVIGFVHSRDVLLAFNDDKESSSIKDIIRPIIKVSKHLKIDDLMKEFQKKKTHMAVVLSVGEKIEGIATLEDVVEELVGEIVDEHDLEPPLIKRIDNNEIICSGETEIRDINKFFNVNLSGDPFDSISDIILDEIEKVPVKDFEIGIDNVKCVIIEANKKIIKKVKIVKL